MKRKHKQMLIIWVGLLAGLLIFRGGWMTYAGLLIFLLDLGQRSSSHTSPRSSRKIPSPA